MDRRQIRAKLVLDELGIPMSVDSFDDRLIIQKAIYLVQAGGASLGYDFRWYLRGPYSPSLSRDAFSIVSELRGHGGELDGWSLAGELVGKLRRIKPLMAKQPQERTAWWLELLASVHFVLAHDQVSPRSAHGICELLRRYNKEFSEVEIEEAMSELRGADLIAA